MEGCWQGVGKLCLLPEMHSLQRDSASVPSLYNKWGEPVLGLEVCNEVLFQDLGG